MHRMLKRRGVLIGLAVAGLTVFALLFLWQRCGWQGCLDIDGLRAHKPAQQSMIVDRHGQELGKLFIERRVIVALGDLPQHVPNAFVAMEDQRF
jgi:membrane carboxypeptidase/penicillin-binding protein